MGFLRGTRAEAQETAMQLAPYDPHMLDDVAVVYNEAATGTPYCYPVTPGTFASIVPAAGRPPHAHLAHSEMLVARDDCEVVGFIHFGMQAPDRHGAWSGVICFLCQRRGRRAAGQALLEAAEQRLRERGATEVLAFHQHHRYPFYHLEHAYVSDRLAHVFALLGANGYERSHGEVYLDWPDYAPVDPGPPPSGLKLDHEWQEHENRRPSLVLRAMKGDHEIGVCENHACGEMPSPPEVRAAFLTHWLGVEESSGRQGLAKYLLARARLELHARGYRHAVISTNWRNYPAMLLYANYGYRVADWTYGFTRTLA
jgi:GNAT superfamily N-acetyltransferase